MEQIIITHRDGTTLKLNSKENVSAITKASQTVELLGVDVVDISVQSAKKLNFLIGDKITIIGRDYTLNTAARERKISENNFQYDMQFEGVQYDLLRVAYNVNINTTSNIIQDISGDSITGNIKLFLDVLISNANRVFGAGKWAIGTYPLNTKTITLTFNDSDNCLNVLQTLCGEDNFSTEFKINIDSSGNRVINIGTIGNNFTYTFQYGKGKGIYELTRERLSSSNIITRLNCFGGSKNIITPKYRASKLCLPTKSKSQSFIEDASAIAKYGIWEGSKEFDDIYPKRTGTISSLGSNVFEFIDSSMDFDLNEKNVDGSTKYLMAGTSAKINFNTGNLAGYEFEITSYNHTTKKFTIISQTDQNGYVFPSTTSAAFQFSIGDKYTISDIYMPQSYIDNAEAELASSGAAYLARYSQPLVQYGLTIDSFFLKNQVGATAESNIIWVGDYIPIKDTDLEVDKTIRVKGFTRDLMLDFVYSLTIADLTVIVSTINNVISGMSNVDKVIKINNLNDPAKARRNWKDSQEILNMIFDVEGDYYTDKIKPLSIDTSMLSVGAKSMQFGLEGTIFQPNYVANKNRVAYVGGTLTHYAILDSSNNPRTWNITDGDVIMLSDAARYVYAKCSRTTSGATILFSTDKISVESDGAYYHFLLGILNAVDINNTRALALMYGFTTVNGRFIKTGRIQSADGNTYFDLDAGLFKGTFKFASGETVQEAIATSANNIQVGGRNYIINSKDEKDFSNTFEIPLSMFSPGETISLSFFGKYATGGTESWAFLVKNGSTGTSGTTLLNITVNEFSYTKKTATITLPSTLDNLRIVCMNVGAYVYHGYLKLIKVERGNKVTDWTPAEEDVEAYTQTKIDGGLVTTGRLEVGSGELGSVNAGISGAGVDPTDVRFWAGNTFANRGTASFRVLQNGKVFATNAEISGKVETNQFKSTGTFVTPTTAIVIPALTIKTLNELATNSFLKITISNGIQAAVTLPSDSSYDGYHCYIVLTQGYLGVYDTDGVTLIGQIAGTNQSAELINLGGQWILKSNSGRNVVQSYVNGKNWYRKYSDGWIEQGGQTTVNGSQTVTLITPFVNADYNVHVNIISTDGSSGFNYISTRSTTNFIAVSVYGNGLMWSAKGF